MRVPLCAVVCTGLLGSACYVPPYKVAQTEVEQKLGSACTIQDESQVWVMSNNAFVVTGTCQVPPKSATTPSTRSFTYLCRNGQCKSLALGDWRQRVQNASRALAAAPAAAGGHDTAASDPVGGRGPAISTIEILIRDQIEANAEAIRACTSNETTAIEVIHAADRTTISLLGKHAGTPAEGCVRTVLIELARLKTSNEGGAPVTVRHSVVAK